MARYAIDPYLFSKEEKQILKALRFFNTPLSISKNTLIPRSTVYFLLGKLKSRGLVIQDKKDAKVVWKLRDSSSTPDESLEKIIKQDTSIQIYDSKEAAEDFLESFVTSKNTKFNALNGDHNIEGWNRNIGIKRITEFNNLINQNKIISDIISSDYFIKQNKEVLGEDWVLSYKNKPTEYHLIDHKYTNYKTQILLHNQKIYIINMDKPLVIEITDTDIFDCFSSLFQFIKDNTKSITLNNI